MTNLDLLAYIDKSIDNSEGQTYQWENHEVLEMLGEIRALASRVPVQGEPNDDREALGWREAEEYAPGDDEAQDDFITGWRGADRSPRAVVPDAATEREALLNNSIRLVGELRAERDAATAAIERVRAIHLPVALETKTVCGSGCSGEWPCDTRAALDGAPEPEPAHTKHVTVPETYPSDCLEWECEHRDEDGQPEDMSACKSRPMEVCVDCMVESGLPRDPDQWEDAGLTEWPCENALPKLPVEGENNAIPE